MGRHAEAESKKDTSELEALACVYDALRKLDRSAQLRVIAWVEDKLAFEEPLQAAIAPTSPGSHASTNPRPHGALAEIFWQANTKTQTSQVLIVACYLHQHLGQEDFSTRDISRELNNLGHRVSNPTHAIALLMRRKPSLILQTKRVVKSGRPQKRYKVTAEGFREMTELLQAGKEQLLKAA